MRRVLAAAVIVAATALVLMTTSTPQPTSAQTPSQTHSVQFGLAGDLEFDPPGGGGGATRDINVPNSLVINPGDRINFVNRSGGGHQVAIFGPNLRQKGTTPATNIEDLTVSHTAAPAWGNYVVPPDGSVPSADDPATDIDERRVRDGLLALGPTPVGVSPADRQAGRIDYSYSFTTPGSYMVICNFRPHLLAYGQATFVIVRGIPPTPSPTPAPAAAAPAPAAPAQPNSVASLLPVPPKTGQAGLLSENALQASAWSLLILTVALVLGARAAARRPGTR